MMKPSYSRTTSPHCSETENPSTLKLPELYESLKASTPDTVTPQYRYFSLDLRDLGLFDLEDSFDIDLASFIVAYLRYWYYDDEDDLADLISSSGSGIDYVNPDWVCEWILHEIDNWATTYQDRFEARFDWLKYERPFKVSEVAVSGHSALLTLRYVAGGDELLSSVEEARLEALEKRW